MFYGFSSLFSFLLLGNNVVANYTPLGLFGALLRSISGYFYWFFGHLFGVEQFYTSLGENVSYAWNFNEWCVKSGVPPVEIFVPILLGFICTIIVSWGIVRLIVKVCSLGKITY